jgi:hypothetical protein
MTLPDPLTGGDPIADVPQWTLDLRLALLDPIDGPMYDSGWTVGSLDAGFAGSFRYRKIGMFVEVAVALSSGSLPVGITTVATAAIPPALRPSFVNARAEAYMGANQIGQFYVDQTNGSIGFIHQTGATRSLGQGRTLYMLG